MRRHAAVPARTTGSSIPPVGSGPVAARCKHCGQERQMPSVMPELSQDRLRQAMAHRRRHPGWGDARCRRSRRWSKPADAA